MVRYSLLRLLIFFGCLGALWLAGLRDRSEQPWLVVGAALLSMVISAFALRGFRHDMSVQLAERVDRRVEAKRARRSDEAVEDGAVDQRLDERDEYR